MRRKIYAIITAGGSGIRMGGNIAKQFIKIGGKPILLRTLELFREVDEDMELLLVINNAYKDYWKQYCLTENITIRHILVSGGITRFHSVKNALKYVPDGAMVMVHDAVRPFVPKKMIEQILQNDFIEKGYDGLVPVMPVIESLREKIFDGDGNVIATNIVNRDKYLFVQTPQAFDATKLKKAYMQAFSQDFTDDASVMEKAGYKITVCDGSRYNIKITTAEDLKIGELYLSLL